MFHAKRILSLSICLSILVIIFIIIVVVDASIGYKKFLKGLIVGALLSKGKGGGGHYQDQHHYFYPVSYYPTYSDNSYDDSYDSCSYR
ncbi:hypothetical protein DERP_007171 [Dermatophagoides pteronyssinus]|uniref:Uncharacterized protein n=1 Tax=Dermatophagoides pteronyssinus TaxID=6956 RepID=A0ABQ8JUC4_DERPT|nr:hypothetical protein DERP_007171 [Dermatophagoides pteronyssinus]